MLIDFCIESSSTVLPINKKEIIALNKFDICNRQKNDLQRELSEYTGKNIIVISSIKRVGLKELILNLTKELNINENEIISGIYQTSSKLSKISNINTSILQGVLFIFTPK